jgi:two-component system, cell cycle sensor histidine kinase and response regulator CckA
MTMPLDDLASALQCTLFPLQVLLVEDDAAARSVFQRVLEREGYSVIPAADGGEALRLLEQTHVPVDVLVTDVQMPGMLGDALVIEVRRAWPELPVLFISAESSFARLPGDAGGRSRFLLKPFAPEELTASVASLLRPRSLEAQPS